jgi:hypothetical protein
MWRESYAEKPEILARRLESLVDLRGFEPLTPWLLSNDPPAKPEALQLLAPQRGLIATGQNQNPAPGTLESHRQKRKQLG